MSAYFRQTAPDTYTATSSAGSFVSSIIRDPDGTWKVTTGKSTAPQIHLEGVTLEAAFEHVNQILLGEVQVK